MKKILWHSNSPSAPTGYGNQTDLFTRMIKADPDYEVCISAFYGREGAPARAGETGIMELPRYKDAYGNDIVQAHYGFTGADAVVSLIDPFALDPLRWGTMNWCSWVPVDCAPVADENLNAIRHAKHVWSMSRFGHEQLAKAGMNPVYVPHGVDTGVYIPIDRAQARKELEAFAEVEIGDKFLVVTVAANKGSPSRKNFAGMIEAFSKFHAQVPESVFYLHTDPRGDNGGDNLFKIAESYGVADAVIFPRQYLYATNQIAPSFVNKVYNAADVFMLLSYGEGFGIPIIEAQAAGCPVIVTNGSAMTELCLSGWTVKAREIHTLNGRFGCRWWSADIDDAVNLLKAAHASAKDGMIQQMRDKARRLAMAYDYKAVYETYMKPALAKIAEALSPSPTGDGEVAQPFKIVQVGEIELKIYENPTGGTAKDAAIEAIRDYGLDQIELEDGDLVVDVGANVGIVSLYLAKKFPKCRVIAFEPHPETFEYLKLNVKVNGVNMLTYPHPVASDTRIVHLGGDVDKNAGGVHIFGTDGQECITAKLSDVILPEDRVGLLKLDCEGAEWEILARTGLNWRNVKRIRGELHTNSTLEYDAKLIERVVEAVPDTVFTVREIADFSPHPPTPSPTGEGEKDAGNVPDVTVIIPTLNGAATINRAIVAALPLQGFARDPDPIGVQIIVIDDGSTDDTAEIVKTFVRHVELIQMPFNMGQVAAMNAGLEMARGRYILFHGDDDWLEPNGLAPLVKALDDAPDSVGFAYGHLQYHGLRNDLMRAIPYDREDYKRHFPAGTGMIWRRCLYSEKGIQYRTLHEGKTGHAEDFDLVLQIIKAGYTGVAVDHTVINYTLAAGRATAWLHANQDAGVLAKFKERHPEFIGRL